MKNTLMMALCGLGILAAGCTKPHQPATLTLQGTWSGQEVGGRMPGSPSLVLEGAKLEFHGANTNEWYRATFSLREDTTPRQLEAVVTECPFPKYVGKTVHGIYTMEGGRLTFAANEPGNPLVPSSFDAKGSRKFVFTKK